MKLGQLLLFTATLVGSSMTFANPLGGPGGDPAMAASACAGKSAGDTVSLKGPDGTTTLNATCRLVALPNPPAEAVAACNGKAEGDAVTFSATINNNTRTVTGTCKMIFDQLVALPEKPQASGRGAGKMGGRMGGGDMGGRRMRGFGAAGVNTGTTTQ